MMKTIRLVLLAFILALIWTPVSAQGEAMDEVTVTFRLTLYGNAPDGEAFGLSRLDQVFWMGATLCGHLEPQTCEGDGAVYTKSFRHRRGATLLYRLRRWRPGKIGGEDVFDASQSQTLHEDTTISLYYKYGENGEPLGGGKEETEPGAGGSSSRAPEKLPDSGAGGAAGGVPGASPIAALVGLLVAAGIYRLRRHM